MADEVKSILGGGAPEGGIVEKQVIGPEGGAPPVVPAEPGGAPGAGGTFDYSKIVAANGELLPNWREGLPAEIRDEKCLGNIKHISALVQSYVHGQHAIGANKIALPGKDATPEEKNAFYAALGRPAAPADYKFDVPEQLKDAVDVDGVNAFREFAFQNGLSQDAFAALVQYDLNRATAAAQASVARLNAEYEATESALKAEYGDKYQEFVNQAVLARDTFGLGAVLEQHGIENNLDVLKALYKIGSSISESKLKGPGAPPVISDPASRIAEITGNPDDPYHKADHPQHKQRVELVGSLLAQKARLEKAAAR